MSFPHTLEDREDGLAHCLVCGGAERSMPQDCPGTRMSISRADQVYAGHFNYIAGKWVAGSIVNHRFVPNL